MSLDPTTKQVLQKLVGEQFKLPPAVHTRLGGDSIDELRADAKVMRTQLGMPALDEQERDSAGRFARDTASMNQLIRQASGR